MSKVLIVDDEKDIVEVLKARLENIGLEALSASDGAQGMEMVKSNKPDLIILDVMMPNLNGYEFVREIKGIEEFRNIPIIVLTAKEELDDLFKQEGVVDYVVKPYNEDELLGKVARLIAN